MVNKLNQKTNQKSKAPTQDPHILQKIYSKNPHISEPQESIHKDIYSFITTERPDLVTL
jgi:hypothetical protein